MIKKIILGISLLFSTVILAQEGTASPYSFYGIGDVKFKGTNENRAMGTVGVFVDSIHVNLQNPASYSFLKYTSLTVGGANTRTTFKTNSQEEKAQRTTLDYLAVGLPLGKAGVSFGIIPYSAVGYKVQRVRTTDNIFGESETRTETFQGEGGLNKVFLGGAYKITPKLSFGMDLQYSFGGIETKSIVFVTDPAIAVGSRTKNESTYSGFSVTTGLFYHTKLKNNLEWSNSFTFTPESNLNSNNSRNVALVTYGITGAEFIGDNSDVEVADSKFKIPSKVSFGTAFGKSKKWFVGTEVTLQGKNDGASQENVGFESASRFAVGGFYIPKYNSFRNYFERIVYRAGFRHENTGLIVNNQSIRDTGVSFGFGFPVGTSISNINLGFEYGKKGTTSNNLIQENYFNINIGLSFSDRWFVKPKYD
ncbi:porin family protein [Flavobacterium saliperosum]|uniref:Long-chain fatty acid transport protein n=1 Tax=Flavobacterium saliperosum TaxID=329186 RepID=A0A1G4VWI7_9FLAO|nr:hypothetical protein [Flavobacterium saliperosum]SCX12998.1 hypothetical protein SAMN02927925_01884 [Flavobacterium saliperosum]